MTNLVPFFLAQGEQTADSVMARLTAFIRAAKQSLDIAVYDMRFSDALRAQLVAALADRAKAGVQIRFCYDGDKPVQPNVAAGQDPAPAGTSAFVQSLGYPWRRIAGMKLMHSKFIVRDRESLWTGSTNMTDDAFTLMENNVVTIDSAPLAAYYADDFEQLWEKENFENTGKIHTEPVTLTYAEQPATARVMFSPGCGLEIDTEIARRVRICSLLINSGTLINELLTLLHAGRVNVDGIYETKIDRPPHEHPKRPVTGFDCHRSEVSGERLWGLFAKRFGTAQKFFRDHFVANYCPLAFLEESGRNRTPDKLPPREREALFAACDAHLRAIIRILKPKWLIGIGEFALQRAREVVGTPASAGPRLGRILHPSPACPASNTDWPGAVTAQLRQLGIWK